MVFFLTNQTDKIDEIPILNYIEFLLSALCRKQMETDQMFQCRVEQNVYRLANSIPSGKGKPSWKSFYIRERPKIGFATLNA